MRQKKNSEKIFEKVLTKSKICSIIYMYSKRVQKERVKTMTNSYDTMIVRFNEEKNEYERVDFSAFDFANSHIYVVREERDSYMLDDAGYDAEDEYIVTIFTNEDLEDIAKQYNDTVNSILQDIMHDVDSFNDYYCCRKRSYVKIR